MTRQTIEFGDYSFDTHALSLSKAGQPVALRLQAASLLNMLLQAAPEYLSRRQIREALWEKHTSVDVDGALNAVVRELRAALGDTAEEQRFVETLPKRGYRFCHELTDHSPTWMSGRARWVAGVSTMLLGTLAFAYLAGIANPGPVRLAVLPAVQIDTGGSGPSIAYRSIAKLLSALGRVPDKHLIVVGSENVRRFGADSILDTAGIAADFFLETDAVENGDALDVVAILRSRSDANETRRFEKAYSLAETRDEVENRVQRDLMRWICEELSIAQDADLIVAEQAGAGVADALIRARWLREQDEMDRQLDALALYESILADHPENGEAQAGKLLILLRGVDFYGPRRRQLMDVVETLSLQLSDGRVGSGGLADMGIAFVRQHRDWDLDAARRHAETAVALNPRNAQAHAVYSSARAAAGDLEGAIASAEVAGRIVPDLWARIDLCFFLGLSRQFERARDFCGWAYRTPQGETFFGVQEAFATFMLGEEREAVNRMIEVLRNSDPDAADRLAEQHLSWREFGCSRAEHLVGVVEAQGLEDTRIPFTSIAHYWAQCGNKTELLLWLQRAIDARELWVTFFRFDARFDAWRSDPDFLALLAPIYDD